MKRIFILTIVCALLLPACGEKPVTPPAPFGETISECFPSRKAQVWEDSNGNGAMDEGERPLEGISINMYRAGTLNSNNTSTGVITDAEGKANLHGIGDFGLKCDELDLAVTVPNDYLPTTPTTVSLIGKPRDYVAQFGLISQFPTPAPFVDLKKLLSGAAAFEACNLLTADDFASVLGAPLEFPPISAGAIAEFGPTTYDCMTDPSEPNVFLHYALAIETDTRKAENWFNEVRSMNGGAVPVENLGERSFTWTSEDGVSLFVAALQGNVYLNLQLHFGIEAASEHRARLLELARLILVRLFERGG